jgi:peptide/nickel transport system permease protein
MRFDVTLKELWHSGVGKTGLLLLFLLFGASVYVLATFPLDFGPRSWSNPAVWADNPKAAPPTWSNLFRRDPAPEHRVYTAQQPDQIVQAAAGKALLYRFQFDYPFQKPPTFLAFTMGGVTYYGRPPLVTVILRRPDGLETTLYRHVPRGPREGETPPFRRYHETPLRIQLSNDSATVTTVQDFARQAFGLLLDEQEVRGQVDRILFGQPAEDGTFTPLMGIYEVDIRVSASEPEDEVGFVRFVVGGGVFGLMGTDAVGRDLTQGLLFGLPVALFIGLAAAVLTTSIGTVLGIASGYMGGRTDLLIQRLADIIANIPVLPLLIFMLFIVGSNLMLIILILVVFSWPGLTIQVRSMVLQMRTSLLIEAIQSLGSSRTRIMFRHILPQVAPYVLAQLIFAAPSAILAEAGLSFLGLGDPSIPTWGQILESGFRTGGVYVGYWWWIVPPGLLIVLTALTFMLISLGLEPIVNPRLRR